MSLDFCLERKFTYEDGEKGSNEIFWANITHNLNKMAEKAGIYEVLWHPYRINVEKAWQAIPIIEEGLKKLKANPDYYQQFDSPNGWGLYIHFVPFVEKVLKACQENPNADIRTST